MMEILKQQKAYLKAALGSARGSIVWYLVAGLAGVGVFYVIYFMFWTEIKSWFIHGK